MLPVSPAPAPLLQLPTQSFSAFRPLNPDSGEHIRGSTLTFQLTSQVAGDNLGVTTISGRLLAKLARGNQKPPPKTELLPVCG